MGACVTPSTRTKHPILKEVQIKDGSIVQPAPTSALRYVNNSGQPQRSSIVNRDTVNSQIRANSIERPISPSALPPLNNNSSYLVRPKTPSTDMRPAVQSILPTLNPNDMNVHTIQRPSLETPPPIPINQINPNLRAVDQSQMRIPNTRSDIQISQQFQMRTGNTNQTQQLQTMQTVQRTSSNIPLPVAPQLSQIPQAIQSNIQNQQFISETVARKDSRQISSPPYNNNIPGMQSQIATSTVQRIVDTANRPINIPTPPYSPINNINNINGTNNIIGAQSHMMNTNANQFSNARNSLAFSKNMVPQDRRQGGLSPVINAVSRQRQTYAYQTPVAPVTNLKQIPQSRPVVALNPNLNLDKKLFNFDKKLLNFDKSMFSMDSRTPQLNSFTYDLDMPISGETKTRIL